MKFTFYGHACFGIEVGGTNILFDPFISPNPLASSIDLESVQADFMLITHGHEDHVADAERIARRAGSKVVSNFEIVSWFQSKGIENVHPMNHGGRKAFDFGTVKYVNAIHSSVLPDGTYGGNPGGFVVETDEGNFYNAGDTALTMDMKLIGQSTKLDWAIVPIGDNFTMGPEDACTCCEFVGVKKAIGIHFGTFPYIEIDTEKAKEVFNSRGVELIIPTIGGTIEM